MHTLTKLILIALLVASVEKVVEGRGLQNATAQEQGAEQGEQQNASPEQQQPQTSSSAAVQSVAGCLVRSDSGYSLKTDTDILPIETDKDLSQYVGKKIKVTGILEHHSASSSSAAKGPVTITDLRLRLVATVIGDCNQASK
jgi:hypothetical protein